MVDIISNNAAPSLLSQLAVQQQTSSRPEGQSQQAPIQVARVGDAAVVLDVATGEISEDFQQAVTDTASLQQAEISAPVASDFVEQLKAFDAVLTQAQQAQQAYAPTSQELSVEFNPNVTDAALGNSTDIKV